MCSCAVSFSGVCVFNLLVPNPVWFLGEQHDRAVVPDPVQPHLHQRPPSRQRSTRQGRERQRIAQKAFAL